MSALQSVWVTGGSSGIGADLCQRLLEDGAEVVSFARREPPFKHSRLHVVGVDLTDAGATRTAAERAAAAWPATRLVHNAGAIREKPLAEVTGEDLNQLTQLHIGTAVALVQALLPNMRRERFGRIVLMSTRAVVGLEKRTVYSATKAGLIGMGRTWALELAGEGITVNMIAPGPIEDTQMFHDVIPKDSDLSRTVAGRVPVGRLGTPADISRAVLFFLNDNAGFVTGQTLFVCGGTSLGGMSFT